MYVTVAYLAVVIIWSTTPLGIVWSSESVDPILAVFLRMTIAAILGYITILFTKISMRWDKQAMQIYGYSLIGVYGAMLFSYMAARYIPSGLMSLLFGLSPLLSGLLAQKLLGEPPFGPIRWAAMILSLFGLFTICADNILLSNNGWIGILLILSAVFLFSFSAVMVKKVNANMNPLGSTVGTLVLSLPLYGITWLILGDTPQPEQWQARSIYAIVYLGFFGSFLGFVAYFFILNRLQASTVTMVTLITPVIALMFGSVLNDEKITNTLIVGATLVLTGLAIYCWHKQLRKILGLIKPTPNNTL